MASKNKYYTVWQGRSVGVFDSWEKCKEAVMFCDAKYKSFPTLQEAQEAYTKSYEDYVEHAPLKSTFDIESLPATNRPVVPSICVDAACSGNPGKLEFRGVETLTGAELFHRGPFDEGTQNIGEFLAIAFALAILQKSHTNLTIYSDSMVAMKWIHQKNIATKLKRNSKNEALFTIVDKAVAWLNNNEFPNPILKWKTEEWGEIPADFGRK